MLTLLLWVWGPFPRRHSSLLCSERLPPGSRHLWSLRPRGCLAALCFKKTSSPAESEPAEERPCPLPSSLSEAGALLPVGPPAGGTGEASPRPQPAAPFNPCLSGLLSLHSVCH